MRTAAPLKSPATAPDYLTTIRDGWAQAMQQWVDQSTTTWDQWSEWSKGWARAVPPSPHRGDRDCGCHADHRHDHADRDRGCRGDSCACCVPKADVIVHARAGEVRIVPFRLVNRWRREREVTLAVGPWHGCSGQGLEVRGVLEEEKLVMAPCEDRIVRLLISVRGAKEGGDSTTPADPGTEQNADQAKVADARSMTGRRTVDVPDCVSAYADVRFEGCSRPQRVAVVVSPAECDPVDVCCDCGCC
jgi:hypothetical protein